MTASAPKPIDRLTDAEREYMRLNMHAFAVVLDTVLARANQTAAAAPFVDTITAWGKTFDTFAADDVRLTTAFRETSRAAVGLLSSNAIITALTTETAGNNDFNAKAIAALRQHGNGPVLEALMYDLIPVVAQTMHSDAQDGVAVSLNDRGYVASLVYPGLTSLFYSSVGRCATAGADGTAHVPDGADLKALTLIAHLTALAMPSDWMAARLSAAMATEVIETRSPENRAAFDTVIKDFTAAEVSMRTSLMSSPNYDAIKASTHTALAPVLRDLKA